MSSPALRLSALTLLALTGCGGPEEIYDTAVPFAADAEEKAPSGEYCDGEDNDFDGQVDEGCGQCETFIGRSRSFWVARACVVQNGPAGEPLIPVTVGAIPTTYSTWNQVRNALNAVPTTNKQRLGQQIIVAKFNRATFNTGSLGYHDWDSNGDLETVDELIALADTYYNQTGPLGNANQGSMNTLLTALNAEGNTLPLYFDTTCVNPPELCDGTDNDGDGSVDENCGCIEVCDGYDNDFDGVTDEGGDDMDGDGYACDDCDDSDAAIYPGAVELYNGFDDDCDGVTDEGTAGYDDDGDGIPESGGDCDDGNPFVFPGAFEQANGIDDDCDGAVDEFTVASDDDGDGYTELAGDCNDAAFTIYPGATERPNGIDEDCDGIVDEGTVNYDDDGDGLSESGGDCNDANNMIRPGATELANGVDDDCDGVVDEGTTSSDDDGDGYSEAAGDCNDSDSGVSPGALEVCDGIDNDCDGSIDEGTGGVYWADGDADGYGDASMGVSACSAPGGYVANDDDCDDGDGAVNPSAAEVCNSIDDDCDGLSDDADPSRTGGSTWYRDADGDTYGSSTTTTMACSMPSGYVASSTDCNDGSSAVNPGATEIRGNGIDDNCDGTSLNYTYSYATNIQPIFNSRCTGCHGSSGGSSGLELASGVSYADLVNVASSELPSMDRIEPGSPSTSYLYHKINNTQGTVGGSGSRMPPSGAALTSTQISTINTWISEGAPNN